MWQRLHVAQSGCEPRLLAPHQLADRLKEEEKHRIPRADPWTWCFGLGGGRTYGHERIPWIAQFVVFGVSCTYMCACMLPLRDRDTPATTT